MFLAIAILLQNCCIRYVMQHFCTIAITQMLYIGRILIRRPAKPTIFPPNSLKKRNIWKGKENYTYSVSRSLAAPVTILSPKLDRNPSPSTLNSHPPGARPLLAYPLESRLPFSSVPCRLFSRLRLPLSGLALTLSRLTYCSSPSPKGRPGRRLSLSGSSHGLSPSQCHRPLLACFFRPR